MGLRIDKSVAITVLIVATLMVQVRCQRPKVINLGAVFTFDSVIGRAAKVALEAAVSDVNADTSLLQETELRLFVEDSSCNVFHGSFAESTLGSQTNPPLLTAAIVLPSSILGAAPPCGNTTTGSTHPGLGLAGS
ncbi:hypothetical protein YC2023_055111 [Brassica napus]